ncbi:MAG TPA: DUF222 domain-containing protein [Acidimicrobiales bacterium]|nr:DUF222 domain-containing protein [Acidimicrobiales bacterium]
MELAGVVAATQVVLGSVIVAADAARDWAEDGATDMASWLVARCGITTAHAREWVRVAHALEELPALREVFSSGVVSFDQVRPATRFATPATEGELADRLPGLSAAQVEVLARQHRPVKEAEVCEARARRCLHWRPDHDAGGFRYRGFLPTDQAVAVNEMLTGLAEAAGPNPETGLWDPFAARCADALHGLCDGDTVETTVVVHVDAEVVAGNAVAGGAEGNGLAGDMSVGRSAVLRYLCDTGIEHVIETVDGRAVGIGRRSRTVPRWLRRHITHRDRTCRFPGCERAIRHIHHVRHWTAHRGPTDAPNLLGLCWAHHHLVHDGGWTVTGNPDDQVTFTSPTGRTMTSTRHPIRPHTTTRTRALLGLPEGATRGGGFSSDPGDPDGRESPSSPSSVAPGPGSRVRHRHPDATGRRRSESSGDTTRPRGP